MIDDSFERAEKYKLRHFKKTKTFLKDDFILLLLQHRLYFKYTKIRQNYGMLELYNEDIDLIFKCWLL